MLAIFSLESENKKQKKMSMFKRKCKYYLTGIQLCILSCTCSALLSFIKYKIKVMKTRTRQNWSKKKTYLKLVIFIIVIRISGYQDILHLEKYKWLNKETQTSFRKKWVKSATVPYLDIQSCLYHSRSTTAMG